LSNTKKISKHGKESKTADKYHMQKSRRFALVIVLSISIFLLGCSRQNDSSSPVINGDLTAFQTGTASWYGEEFQGKRTASGEIFDMNALTAAHRTLPFGTFVEVTNLANGRRVIVKINDRGPSQPNRILDISKRAALQFGMIESGTAEVSLKITNSS